MNAGEHVPTSTEDGKGVSRGKSAKKGGEGGMFRGGGEKGYEQEI